MTHSPSIKDVASGIVTGVTAVSTGIGVGGALAPVPPSCIVDQTAPTAHVQEYDPESCAPWFSSPEHQGLDYEGVLAERKMEDLADQLSGPPPGMDGLPEGGAPPIG